MFKICVNCDSLCVLIILSIGLCSSSATQDRQRLLYETNVHGDHKVLSDSWTIDLLPAESRIRRQIHIPPQVNSKQPGPTSASEESQSTHVDNRSGGESPPTTTANNAVVRDNHQPPPRPQPTASNNQQPQPPVATAGTADHQPLAVGVNGTGQRWTNTTAAVSSTVVGGSQPSPPSSPQSPPPVVSEPINATGGDKPTIDNHQPQSPPVIPGTTNNNSGDVSKSGDSFPEDVNDATLAQHNITTNKTDTHEYYNSTVVVDKELGQKYWDEFASEQRLNSAQVSELLSSSHRRAVTVQLSFSFPFYGHPVRNVTVATGGFLYTGDYVHSWLAATQYIAPLMANFDTSLSNDSYVKFYDNGTAFTVLWENVSLQDRPRDGSFTFSATLLASGDIIFVYKTIPLLVEKIEDNKHPVKVGLSDAYIIDRTVFFTRRKTIYEYHRVQFKQEDIRNWTTVHLKALPTCVLYTDCEQCLKQSTAFMCAWCPATNRCSSGMDRHRQEWLSKGCNLTQVRAIDQCPALGSRGNNATVTTASPPTDTGDSGDRHHHGGGGDGGDGWASSTSPTSADGDAYDTHSTGHRAAHHSSHPVTTGDSVTTGDTTTGGGGGAVAILVPLCLIVAIAGWLLYAYRNPHTKSGQMLIRYRPSQWTWRRGEARYTAATIHM